MLYGVGNFPFRMTRVLVGIIHSVAVLRGAVRSGGDLPRLIESLRSPSGMTAADAIRIAMELPGPETTRALVGELAAATEAEQILLLQAIHSISQLGGPASAIRRT
jgi:hypothetical protein